MRTSTFSYIYITVLLAMAAVFSSCDSNISDSGDVLSENVGFKNAQAASVIFDVEENTNTPTSGSVTVSYLGEEVTTNFTSTWTPLDLAATIAQNINTDPDIKLSATIPSYSEANIRVEEERTGSQYNGNQVTFNDNNQYAHLYVVEHTQSLSGGQN